MSDEAPMPPAIGWVCVDCSDLERHAHWWGQLLGGEVTADEDDDVHLDAHPVPP
jgi:hypothetical protein